MKEPRRGQANKSIALMAIVSAILVAAALVVWYLWNHSTTYLLLSARKQLKQNGHDVEFSHIGIWPEPVMLRLTGNRLEGDIVGHIRNLGKAKSIRYIVVDRCCIDDDFGSHLAALGPLRRVFLTQTGISRETIEQFLGLATLKAIELRSEAVLSQVVRFPEDSALVEVDIHECRVAFENVRGLAKLAKVQWLSFRGSDVDDRGIRELKTMGGLTSLDLCGTKITDESARVLAEMKGLKYIGLLGTAVTADGVREIVSALSLEAIEVDGRQVVPEGEGWLARRIKNVIIDGKRVQEPLSDGFGPPHEE